MNCFKLNIEDKLIPLENNSQWSRYYIELTDGKTEDNIYIHLDNLDIFLPEIQEQIKSKFQDLAIF